MEFQQLHFVSFSNLANWSTYTLLGKGLSYTDAYPFVKIGSFLKRNKTQVKVKDDILYKRATIKINNGGIHLRDEVLGETIGTKNQFKIKKSQFLLSKIDARNGAFGVVPTELDNGIITGNFWTFDVDTSLINPHYLSILTGTPMFQRLCQSASVGTTNRNYLQEDLFHDFEIPLPSLTEQEEILASYNANMQNAMKLAFELEIFNATYENTLFEFLGITKIPVKEATNSLQFINLVNTSRWGYQYLLNHEQSERLLDTKKYPQKLLSSLVLLNPTTSFNELKKDDKISFLPMECVSDLYGEVIEYREGDVKSSGGYTKFQEGDLLWSKITPCMQNGKSCIVENLENGFGYGSTEYHVIREKEDSEIHLRFLYHILRTKYVLTNATFHFTGSAGQQRVPIEFLANLNVPLPSIDEQKEISIELDKLIADRKVKQVKVTELKEQAIKDFEAKIFKN